MQARTQIKKNACATCFPISIVFFDRKDAPRPQCLLQTHNFVPSLLVKGAISIQNSSPGRPDADPSTSSTVSLCVCKHSGLKRSTGRPLSPRNSLFVCVWERDRLSLSVSVHIHRHFPKMYWHSCTYTHAHIHQIIHIVMDNLTIPSRHSTFLSSLQSQKNCVCVWL